MLKTQLLSTVPSYTHLHQNSLVYNHIAIKSWLCDGPDHQVMKKPGLSLTLFLVLAEKKWKIKGLKKFILRLIFLKKLKLYLNADTDS